MSENKTKPTRISPQAFIRRVKNEQRRKDAFELLEMMQEVTGKPPKMWGPTIVGFDQYHYRYQSGREGDAPLAAFSPRTSELVIYLDAGPEQKVLLEKLGKHRASVSCLYVKKLDDVDRRILKDLVKRSVIQTRRRHPA